MNHLNFQDMKLPMFTIDTNLSSYDNSFLNLFIYEKKNEEKLDQKLSRFRISQIPKIFELTSNLH